ncbi:MAG: alkene reductase [Myxococcales bacterium]|nr:alkene reductase [Myxococcales bacterium]
MLFDSTTLAGLSLKNRFVMAPMTRSRAEGNVPNALMAEYYAQRAGAGLIVTEGTSPSPNGLGYSRIPGLFSAAQVEGWKLVTKAVHDKGGAIFAQLMHTGRVGHVANLPAGAEVVGPTAVACPGDMYTDAEGPKPHSAPRAMTEADIAKAVAEHVTAAKNAVAAGFDGVEIHGANGYLVEQFLNANVNTRTDGYGGSAENRNRFALEIVRAVADAIGKNKVGIRISPHGAFNATGSFDGVDAQYLALAKELSKLGIAYLHFVDHSSMGAPPVPAELKRGVREAFAGAFVLSGGYDAARAEADLVEKRGDLVAFGRPFLANPDLVARFAKGAPLNDVDMATFYTPGPKGYTDYPAL